MNLKMLIYKILGIPLDKPDMRFADSSYRDGEGWYVMEPKGWKIGMKMSPDHNTLRVDMKSLREHVFGGKDEESN